jgi:hypothetical protein
MRQRRLDGNNKGEGGKAVWSALEFKSLLFTRTGLIALLDEGLMSGIQAEMPYCTHSTSESLYRCTYKVWLDAIWLRGECMHATWASKYDGA